MINGLHTLVYSSEPEALHAPFCATRRASPRIAMSATAGWSSDSPRRTRGVHPADPSGACGQPPGIHDVSSCCDNIRATVAELKGRGVVFDGEMPGALRVQFNQPHNEKSAGRSAACGEFGLLPYMAGIRREVAV